MNIKDSLEKIVGPDNVSVNEPMKNHTSFRIGGNADYVVTPKTYLELAELIRLLNNERLNYYLIGNGSNILVKDGGYRGIIIKTQNLNNINVYGRDLYVDSGASLRDIASAALENSLTGYEFASGIPGSIGGAVRMNAGAYDREHKDVVEKIVVFDGERFRDIGDPKFSYRYSVLKDLPHAAVFVKISLEPGDKDAIDAYQKELTKARISKQPLDYPSAGSTFKRPKRGYASRLIDSSGLKGKSVGGAEVSQKHAGFVINKNDATAKDVLDLIEEVVKTVRNDTGIELEPEVIILGE